MNAAMMALVAAGAAMTGMLGMFYGKRRDKVKELIKELEAAHKRINNPDDALRLSNEIGIAILKLAQEEKEERKDRRHLSDLRAAENAKRRDKHERDVNARLDAADKKYDEVIARCERIDAETHRLLRKIAGEPEAAPEPVTASDDPWSFTAIATPEKLRELDLKWKFHAKDYWFVMATGDRTGWVESGATRGVLFGRGSPLEPREQQRLLDRILARNEAEPDGPVPAPSEGEVRS